MIRKVEDLCSGNGRKRGVRRGSRWNVLSIPIGSVFVVVVVFDRKVRTYKRIYKSSIYIHLVSLGNHQRRIIRLTITES